jgi:hypothetical protein
MAVSKLLRLWFYTPFAHSYPLFILQEIADDDGADELYRELKDKGLLE